MQSFEMLKNKILIFIVVVYPLFVSCLGIHGKENKQKNDISAGKSLLYYQNYYKGELTSDGSTKEGLALVFIAVGRNNLYALDVKDGSVRWKKTLGGDSEGRIKPNSIGSAGHTTDRSMSGKPVVEDGILFLGSAYYYFNSYMHALDALSGKEIWKVKTDKSVSTSPIVKNGNVYFASEDGYMHAVQKDTGQLVWKKKLPEEIWCRPAIINNTLFVPVGSNRRQKNNKKSYLIALDAKTGKKLWEIKDKEYIRQRLIIPPVAKGNTLFTFAIDANTFCALSAENGKVLWKYKLPFRMYTYPIIYNDQIFFGVENDILILDIHSGKEIEKLFLRKQIDRYVWYGKPISSILIEDDVAYVAEAGQDHLYAFDLRSGREIWHKEIDLRTGMTPVVIGNVIYWGAGAIDFFALDKKTGKEIWSTKVDHVFTNSPVMAD